MSVTDPDAGTRTNWHDALGQQLNTVDGSDQSTWFNFDALGRKTSRRNSNQTADCWVCDAPNPIGKLEEMIRVIGSDWQQHRDCPDPVFPKKQSAENNTLYPTNLPSPANPSTFPSFASRRK
jgi:YD repeat-containing protein